MIARQVRRRVRAHRRLSAAVTACAVCAILFGGYLARASRLERPLRFDYMETPMAADPLPRPYSYTVADMTGDGRADLVFSHMSADTNMTRIAVADGRGGFDLQPAFLHPHVPPEGWNDRYVLFTGDFDGDGRRDLLWNAYGTTMPNRAYVAFGGVNGFRFADGSTIGPTRWSISWTMQVADVDGDGADDLVFSVLNNTMNRLTLALSKRDGTFDDDLRFAHRTANWLGYRTFMEDVDGDGLIDVVWNGALASGNRTYVARARGGGNFDLLSYQDVEGDWGGYMAAVGDVNGDGRADLVWADAAGARPLRMAYGTRAATFELEDVSTSADAASSAVLLGRFTAADRARVAWLPSSAPADARAADVDGDGLEDIIWHDPATRVTTVGISRVR